MARKNIWKLNLLDINQHLQTHYDKCTYPNCNYEFREADWTYYGKDKSGNWQHVCEAHCGNIQWICLQVLGHMPKDIWATKPYTIPCYSDPPQPDIDLWLWRYMNLDRFKEFVETKSIFFPKAQTFLKDDPLECAVSIHDNKNWLSNLRTIAYPTFDSELNGLSEEEKNQKIESRKQEDIVANKDFRDKVLISCWHANDYESAAMWKLYKGDRYYRTVAISISMVNLRNALPIPVHIGEVEYVDYEKVYPTKIRAFKKHISYEHENEIRAVIFPEHINDDKIKNVCAKEKENGLLIKLDETYLEIKVYISPWSSKKFKNDVRKYVKDSDWNKEGESNPLLRIIPSEYNPIY